MKETFAKLFELEHCQVLVTKEYREDDYAVTQKTYIDNNIPEITLGFKTEELMCKFFDSYEQSNAEKFYGRICEMYLNV